MSENNYVNIAFCCDENYKKQLSTAIISILKNSKPTTIYSFKILHKNFKTADMEKIKSLVRYSKNKNAKFEFINIPKYTNKASLEHYLSKKETYNYITDTTYYRFYIEELFQDIDKILYLDVDIIVRSDLYELYKNDIENFAAIAVECQYVKKIIKKNKFFPQTNIPVLNYFKNILNKKTKKYFNAGVLLMNLKYFRKNNLTNKLWDFLEKNKDKIAYQDQDVLNSILDSKVKYLDSSYNKQSSNSYKDQNIKILHFIGDSKPWNTYNHNTLEYFKYMKLSPFYKKEDENIIKAKKRINIKLFNFTIFNFSQFENYTLYCFLGLWIHKTKKIKTGLIIDEFFGGANTAYGGYGFLARKYIAKYIKDKNLKTEVILGKGKNLFFAKKYKIDDVNVYKMPRLKIFAQIWLFLKNYDIYLSIELTYPQILEWELNKNKKLILWIQDPRPWYVWRKTIGEMNIVKEPIFYNQRNYNAINKWNREKRVIFISQGYCLNELALDLYMLQNKTEIKYLPNPIDIDFNYKFNIKNKKKNIIFLGRLETQKRAWLFCELAKMMPEYDFFVLGQFFRHKEENHKMLDKYLKGNIKNLHFMGHVDGVTKQNLIKEARILINCAIWEGIPISWLEALSYGTLIVSCLDRENLVKQFGSYTGEIRGDGFEEVKKFIPCVKELMENDEIYSKKALEAIKYIRKTHNISRFRKNLIKTIKENI